jgi:hypothetical protein
VVPLTEYKIPLKHSINWTLVLALLPSPLSHSYLAPALPTHGSAKKPLLPWHGLDMQRCILEWCIICKSKPYLNYRIAMPFGAQLGIPPPPSLNIHKINAPGWDLRLFPPPTPRVFSRARSAVCSCEYSNRTPSLFRHAYYFRGLLPCEH